MRLNGIASQAVLHCVLGGVIKVDDLVPFDENVPALLPFRKQAANFASVGVPFLCERLAGPGLRQRRVMNARTGGIAWMRLVWASWLPACSRLSSDSAWRSRSHSRAVRKRALDQRTSLLLSIRIARDRVLVYLLDELAPLLLHAPPPFRPSMPSNPHYRSARAAGGLPDGCSARLLARGGASSTVRPLHHDPAGSLFSKSPLILT